MNLFLTDVQKCLSGCCMNVLENVKYRQEYIYTYELVTVGITWRSCWIVDIEDEVFQTDVVCDLP